ncbi:hypothetical protein PhaeoP66_04691 (plasmid) [Phaeobacter inhibens]|uniref:Uncharacterized protein n=1 Tax=Phaeobacter inhibens TaxID=221822 RepID=A0ABM6RLS0_9RHOB|nr:hypothetical protein PhaeoP66_01036 [Phaeobacter inhibens]AUQ97417.1 hypothetical protein PhaeoP66_04691 [Phaeobacter inhibens]
MDLSLISPHILTWSPIAISALSFSISYLAYRRTSPPPKAPRGWTEIVGIGELGSTHTLSLENHTVHPFLVKSITCPQGPLFESVEDNPATSTDGLEVPEISINQQLPPSSVIEKKFAIPLQYEDDSPSVQVHLACGSRYRKKVMIEIAILAPQRK